MEKTMKGFALNTTGTGMGRTTMMCGLSLCAGGFDTGLV